MSPETAWWDKFFGDALGGSGAAGAAILIDAVAANAHANTLHTQFVDRLPFD